MHNDQHLSVSSSAPKTTRKVSFKDDSLRAEPDLGDDSLAHMPFKQNRAHGIRLLRYAGYRIGQFLPLKQLHLRQTPAKRRQPFMPMPLEQTGNCHHGEKILRGYFYCQNGQPVRFYEFISRPRPDTSMLNAGLGKQDIQELQSYDWLADIHAFAHTEQTEKQPSNLWDSENPLDEARLFCAEFIQKWIIQYAVYHPISWHIPTLARRINNWLFYYPDLLNYRNPSFDANIMRSITMQMHHLRLCVMHQTRAHERLSALICWLNASMCLQTEAAYLQEGVDLLSQELTQQLSQFQSALMSSPLQLNVLLQQLRGLNDGFAVLGLNVPQAIAAAEEYIAIVLRYYQFRPQKRLANFHGCHAYMTIADASHTRASRQKLTILLNKYASQLELLPLKRIDHHGFSVFIDTTDTPKHGAEYHRASALALELADQQNMIFVNALPFHPKSFRKSYSHSMWRASASHSTLLIETEDWAEVSPKGINPRYTVTSTINRHQGQIWFQAAHDAYIRRSGHSGGTLQRVLYFFPDDQPVRAIRGQDSLILPDKFRAKGSVTLISQFHLHPNIEVTPLKGGSVLLRERKKRLAWDFSSPNDSAIVLLNHQESAESNEWDDPDQLNQPAPLQSLRISLTVAHPQAGESHDILWELKEHTSPQPL